MARAKKTSKTIGSANLRLASIKSIDAKLDLGNNVTVDNFNKMIEETATALEEYNTVLSMVDEKKNVFDAKEKELKAMHERVLDGVAFKFGKDSNEYEKAGGVKKSDRKRPVRKKKEQSK